VGVAGIVGLALAVVVSLAPPLRARAKAVAVLARSIGFPLPRPFAARVNVRTVRLAPDLTADLYDPGLPAPGIVLAPGGAIEGKSDPRLVRVARSIAGARRLVLVPNLELSRRRFVWQDVERVVEAVTALASIEPGGRVGLAGISYGGSFALLAAEQPQLAERLQFVAVFGSFVDLLDLVQGVTTGATTFDGRVVRWNTVPEARSILRQAALNLVSPVDRGPLSNALADHEPSGLSADARPVYELLANTDPGRTLALARGLPPSFLATLRRFSPDTQIRSLGAPLFIMQSENDTATPPTEALRLHALVPGSKLILLHHFLHVDAPGRGTSLTGIAADAWGAWQFVSWVLSSQE
jgi:pimeloyl-ACP methyl ester carboxylesterase